MGYLLHNNIVPGITSHISRMRADIEKTPSSELFIEPKSPETPKKEILSKYLSWLSLFNYLLQK